jgi:hypothetical protein
MKRISLLSTLFLLTFLALEAVGANSTLVTIYLNNFGPGTAVYFNGDGYLVYNSVNPQLNNVTSPVYTTYATVRPGDVLLVHTMAVTGFNLQNYLYGLTGFSPVSPGYAVSNITSGQIPLAGFVNYIVPKANLTITQNGKPLLFYQPIAFSYNGTMRVQNGSLIITGDPYIIAPYDPDASVLLITYKFSNTNYLQQKISQNSIAMSQLVYLLYLYMLNNTNFNSTDFVKFIVSKGYSNLTSYFYMMDMSTYFPIYFDVINDIYVQLPNGSYTLAKVFVDSETYTWPFFNSFEKNNPYITLYPMQEYINVSIFNNNFIFNYNYTDNFINISYTNGTKTNNALIVIGLEYIFNTSKITYSNNDLTLKYVNITSNLLSNKIINSIATGLGISKNNINNIDNLYSTIYNLSYNQIYNFVIYSSYMATYLQIMNETYISFYGQYTQGFNISYYLSFRPSSINFNMIYNYYSVLSMFNKTVFAQPYYIYLDPNSGIVTTAFDLSYITSYYFYPTDYILIFTGSNIERYLNHISISFIPYSYLPVSIYSPGIYDIQVVSNSPKYTYVGSIGNLSIISTGQGTIIPPTISSYGWYGVPTFSIYPSLLEINGTVYLVNNNAIGSTTVGAIQIPPNYSQTTRLTSILFTDKNESIFQVVQFKYIGNSAQEPLFFFDQNANVFDQYIEISASQVVFYKYTYMTQTLQFTQTVNGSMTNYIVTLYYRLSNIYLKNGSVVNKLDIISSDVNGISQSNITQVYLLISNSSKFSFTDNSTYKLISGTRVINIPSTGSFLENLSIYGNLTYVYSVFSINGSNQLNVTEISFITPYIVSYASNMIYKIYGVFPGGTGWSIYIGGATPYYQATSLGGGNYTIYNAFTILPNATLLISNQNGSITAKIETILLDNKLTPIIQSLDHSGLSQPYYVVMSPSQPAEPITGTITSHSNPPSGPIVASAQTGSNTRQLNLTYVLQNSNVTWFIYSGGTLVFNVTLPVYTIPSFVFVNLQNGSYALADVRILGKDYGVFAVLPTNQVQISYTLRTPNLTAYNVSLSFSVTYTQYWTFDSAGFFGVFYPTGGGQVLAVQSTYQGTPQGQTLIVSGINTLGEIEGGFQTAPYYLRATTQTYDVVSSIFGPNSAYGVNYGTGSANFNFNKAIFTSVQTFGNYSVIGNGYPKNYPYMPEGYQPFSGFISTLILYKGGFSNPVAGVLPPNTDNIELLFDPSYMLPNGTFVNPLNNATILPIMNGLSVFIDNVFAYTVHVPNSNQSYVLVPPFTVLMFYDTNGKFLFNVSNFNASTWPVTHFPYLKAPIPPGKYMIKVVFPLLSHSGWFLNMQGYRIVVYQDGTMIVLPTLINSSVFYLDVRNYLTAQIVIYPLNKTVFVYLATGATRQGQYQAVGGLFYSLPKYQQLVYSTPPNNPFSLQLNTVSGMATIAMILGVLIVMSRSNLSFLAGIAIGGMVVSLIGIAMALLPVIVVGLLITVFGLAYLIAKRNSVS